MIKDIRWKQRFQNFSKALALLREPFAREAGSLSDLEREGILQRFEITFEHIDRVGSTLYRRESPVPGIAK